MSAKAATTVPGDVCGGGRGDTAWVRETEAEIDQAAELRGLTEEELGEMRLSKARSLRRIPLE